MRSRDIVVAAWAVVALGACGGAAASAPHWTYAEVDHWAELDPTFAACRTGRAQSPLALTTADAHHASGALEGNYHAVAAHVVNNGHTVQANVPGAGTLTLDGDAFALQQFHVHVPSEHTIDGARFAMELHFVHKDAAGQIAVIALLVREGAESALLASLGDALPAHAGDAVDVAAVDVAPALAAVVPAFRYEGSLTAPPCTEGVHWIVHAEPVEASAVQIARFAVIVGQSARAAQPANGRSVELVAP